MKDFTFIGFGKSVGRRTIVVAEIGSNHGGSKQTAFDMIDAAAKAGADAVKFQALDINAQYHPSAHTDELRTLFNRIGTPLSWLPELSEHSNKRGVDFLCTPTFDKAVDFLDEMGVGAFKAASVQVFHDAPLIERMAMTGRPLILSSGLADTAKMLRLLRRVRSLGCDNVVVLHCVARYPTRDEDANLSRIGRLQDVLKVPVGYSDHTTSTTIPALAVAHGACLVEKHFTVDRTQPGPDQAVSLEPQEFAAMVAAVRKADATRGDPWFEPGGDDESAFIKSTELKLIAARDLPRGHIISVEDVIRLRAPGGIPLKSFHLVDGARLQADVRSGELLEWSHILETQNMMENPARG